jgi:hypothetical protein
MKISDSIKRLGFTISKQNKPNLTDAEALNAIIEFINLSNKSVIKENELTAKLFCFVLKEFLFHYKNVNFASKIINKEILSKPLEFHLECLKINLQTNEYNQLFENNPTGAEFLESSETWLIEHVKQNFEFNFNLALNTFKNV